MSAATSSTRYHVARANLKAVLPACCSGCRAAAQLLLDTYKESSCSSLRRYRAGDVSEEQFAGFLEAMASDYERITAHIESRHGVVMPEGLPQINVSHVGLA